MIDFRDTSGKIIFSTLPNKGSKRKFELMKEDSITLKFSLLSPVGFKLGYYVLCDFGRFEIVEDQYPTFNVSTGGYDYELKMEAYYMKWKNKIFKYSPENGGNEASWSLTAQLSVHLDIFLRNLKAWGYQYEGLGGIEDFKYEIDPDINIEALYITYSNTNLIDGLTSMAEAAGCEWWMEGRTICFGRCKKGEPVEISLEENAKTITLSKSSGDYFTRIYAFGSTQNISSRYRKRLEFNVDKVEGSVIKDSIRPVTPGMFMDRLIIYDELYADLSSSGAITMYEQENDSNQVKGDVWVRPFELPYKDVPYNIDMRGLSGTEGNISFDFKNYIGIRFNLVIRFISGSISDYVELYRYDDIFVPEKNNSIYKVELDTSFSALLRSSVVSGKVYLSLGLETYKIPNSEQMFLIPYSVKGYIKGRSEYGKVETTLNVKGGNSYPVTINPEYYPYEDEKASDIKMSSPLKIGDSFTLSNIVKMRVPIGYFVPDVDDLTVNGIVQRRLMLPEETPYIDIYPNMSNDEVIEGIVVFDYVYPRKVLTIDAVEEEMIDQTEDDKPTAIKVPVYRIKTTGLVEFDEMYIIGDGLTLTFQAGNETGKLGDKLAGLSFGLTFLKDRSNESETWFEIVANEDYGGRLPDTIMKPSVGDKFVMAGYDTEYIFENLTTEAEQELKVETQKYSEKIKNNIGTVSSTLYSDWSKDYSVRNELLYPFDAGQEIIVNNPAIFETPRIMRVIGYELNFDVPWDSPSYTIGESGTYSRLGDLEDKIDSVNLNGSVYFPSKINSNGKNIYIIKKNDTTVATDSNVFSSLKSLSTFLRKDKSDSTQHILTMLAGAVFGENKANISSEGIAKFISLLIGEKAEISADGKAVLQTLLVEVQAELNKLLVKEGAQIQNGLLADLITLQDGLLKTIISPADIRTAKAIITNVQTEAINNDGDNAVLHGNNADFVGAVGSKTYVPGPAGFGWNVDAKGNAWFNGMYLREFLEVPELRYNRITVITDEQWSAPGGGIIESADTETLILTLKLEEGEAAALEVDDICKGIFHSGTGFSTCFFRITEVLGESTFRYALRPGYEMHPLTAMHFVAYGNFTNPDRQKSAYTTREYTRYLKDVNDWDITERNIVMMMGNLDGMRLNGMDMSGYSAFLRNIYMTGTIRQISGDGVTETPVPAWKGEWKSGTYYKNDEVTHNGSTWLCISDTPTTQEPSITATDWLQTVSEGKDAVVVSVYSTNGLFFQNGKGETELYAEVRQGDANITSSLPAGRFSWHRISRNTDADALWNQNHEGVGSRIQITPDDVEGRSNFDCIVTI